MATTTLNITKRLAPLALLTLLLYTPSSSTTITTLVSQYLPRPLLKALLGLGILRTVNAALNSIAQNNWRISSSSSQKWDWPNELAVVTGGCGGLGLSLVAGLTARGVRVAVLDLPLPSPPSSSSDADADADGIPAALQTNPLATYFPCDVTSPASVAAAAAAIRKAYPAHAAPSILINNAGVANRHPILSASEPALRRVLDVNLLGLWFTTQQFLPAMVAANKGHVMTTASLASFVALPTSVEYSASKAGALAFHEGLACEIKHVYRAPGVVTSVVHPNFVRTPMTAPHAGDIERTQRMLRVEDVTGPMLAQIFSGRGGQLVIPGHLTVLSGLRGWPSWLQEGLRDLLGKQQQS